MKKKFPKVNFIFNKKNLGFGKANNQGVKIAKGKYILFLNSDTVVNKNTIKKTLQYLKEHQDTGALTCKIKLPDGGLDKDARRSFITPWIGLTHLFLKLDLLFPKSKYFGKYWYGYISENTTHEVDVLQGAYLLIRKGILDKIGWFDEDYFLDGEDIDLCWRVKKKGWKIVYYPEVSIIHVKGASKGKNTSTKKNVSLGEKLKYRMTGVNSMEIFYRKRLWREYPIYFNYFVVVGIKLLKFIRIIKVIVLD